MAFEVVAMIVTRHTSSDGELTLVIDETAGDFSVGFERMAWHTHADSLANLVDLTAAEALERYVAAILNSQKVIAVLRREECIIDIWVSDDPAKDVSHVTGDEHLELRYWDGRQFDCL